MTVKLEDYNNCFNVSPTGRAVLDDMEKAHFMKSSTFSPDPYETARNEGERNVVLRILTILREYEEGLKNG